MPGSRRSESYQVQLKISPDPARTTLLKNFLKVGVSQGSRDLMSGQSFELDGLILSKCSLPCWCRPRIVIASLAVNKIKFPLRDHIVGCSTVRTDEVP